MAYPGGVAAPELPAWKSILSALSAIVVAALFLSAGIWKILEPLDWATRVYQLKVPAALAQPFTLALAIAETLAGVLLLVPRFRRWGAWLAGLMLAAFMAWVGIFYAELTGKDCSCFPWLKRAIGPGFFVGDAAMLAGAVLAGLWTPRPNSGKGAAIILGAITVFAGVSFGVAVIQDPAVRLPEQLTLDGQPTTLDLGRYFLYFYDPECSHCLHAAKQLAALDLAGNNVRILQIPTRVPEFAASFQQLSGLQSPVVADAEALRTLLPFRDPPFGVLVEGRKAIATISIFDGTEPVATLRQYGFLAK